MKRIFNILALLAAAPPLALSATALDISQAAVKITSPGEYLVSGSSNTHNITVETTGDVTLRLQGVRLDLESSCALNIKKGNVTLQLQDSSVLIAGGTSINAVSSFAIEDYVAPANDDGKIGVLVATGKSGNGIYGSPVIRSGKLTATINNISYTGTLTITGGSIDNYDVASEVYRIKSNVMAERSNGSETVYRLTIGGCAPFVKLDSAYFSSSPLYGVHDLVANAQGQISVYLPVGKVTGLVKVMGREYSFSDTVAAADSNTAMIDQGKSIRLNLFRNGSPYNGNPSGKFLWVQGIDTIPASEMHSATLPSGIWKLYEDQEYRYVSATGEGYSVDYDLYYYSLAFVARPGIALDTQWVYYGQNGWTDWGKAVAPVVADSADCTLLGWFSDALLTKAFDFAKDLVKKPTTLYAKFSAQCPAYSSSLASSSSSPSSSSSEANASSSDASSSGASSSSLAPSSSSSSEAYASSSDAVSSGASSSSATLSLRQPGLSQGLTMLKAFDLKGRPVYSARVPQDFDLRLLPLRPGHYLVKMDHTLRSWQVPKD